MLKSLKNKSRKSKSRKSKSRKSKSRKSKTRNNTINKRHHSSTRKRPRQNSLCSTEKKALADDFYTHVNYSWMKTHVIPKDKGSTNAFVTTQKKVDDELKKITQKIINEKSSSPNSHRIKMLYDSTMQWNDELVMSQIYGYIKQLNNIRREEGNLYILLAWLLQNGFACPIEFAIINDPKDPHVYVGTIIEGGFSFYMKDMYLKHDKINSNCRKQYLIFLNMMFTYVFGKNHTYNIDKILEIETHLVKPIYTEDEKHDLEKVYNKFTPLRAKQECIFDLNKLSKALGFHKSPSKIIIENPDFLKNAMRLMNKSWTSNDWNSYWVCQILFVASKYNHSLYNMNFGFFGMFMEGVKTPPDKLTRATIKAQLLMNTTISKKYLEYYRNVKQRLFCIQLIERMRNRFRERLTNNSWLHEKTVQLAIAKLNKMNIVVGYKQKWELDPDCDFLPDDAWGNYAKYSNWVLHKMVRECGKRSPSNNVWQRLEEMNVYEVNAYYNNLFNELIIPNAYLQSPFINLDKSIAYNMAYVGTTIGHELTHAFDDNGCKYDENGRYKNWWSEEDMKKYKEKQKQVIHQYESIAKKDKLSLRGRLTLGENIADIGGFILAEDTLEEILAEEGIFGIEQDNFFKEFYYEYAKQWRSITRKKIFKKSLNNDVHSVAKYRVNCVLMRSARFKRIFNILKTDGMWFDIEDTIW